MNTALQTLQTQHPHLKLAAVHLYYLDVPVLDAGQAAEALADLYGTNTYPYTERNLELHVLDADAGWWAVELPPTAQLQLAEQDLGLEGAHYNLDAYVYEQNPAEAATGWQVTSAVTLSVEEANLVAAALDELASVFDPSDPDTTAQELVEHEARLALLRRLRAS